MLNVMFTVDVEVWCGGWENLDQNFPGAFKRYVYGPTKHGDAGLPLTLKLLNQHNLLGVFFVEPLFALRFGEEYLREIVQLILSARGEVQLHLHTEWVNEAKIVGLEHVKQKRQFLTHFNHSEQLQLLKEGLLLLKRAGADNVNAFRAGSCRINRDTLGALEAAGIFIDSSYDAAMGGEASGIYDSGVLNDVVRIDSIKEYPLTVFKDGRGALRHAQIGACSFEELKELLLRSNEAGVSCVTLLSHNFELMSRDCKKIDNIVVRRLEKLFQFLDDNRSEFRCVGYHEPVATSKNPKVTVNVPASATVRRVAEQALRRVFA
jgi:hypothetical protein